MCVYHAEDCGGIGIYKPHRKGARSTIRIKRRGVVGLRQKMIIVLVAANQSNAIDHGTVPMKINKAGHAANGNKGLIKI